MRRRVQARAVSGGVARPPRVSFEQESKLRFTNTQRRECVFRVDSSGPDACVELLAVARGERVEARKRERSVRPNLNQKFAEIVFPPIYFSLPFARRPQPPHFGELSWACFEPKNMSNRYVSFRRIQLHSVQQRL